MSDFHINFKEDKLIWDAFVLSSPQRSVFVYSKFLDSLLVHYDLVTCYENERIVAGAIILYSETGEPINSTFPFTQYQGMLLADNTQKATHSQITHEFKVVEYFLKKLTDCYSKFSLCHSWRLRDLRPFQWHNYDASERMQFQIKLKYTCILDLHEFTSFEKYLSSVRSVRRQEFKKSSKLLNFQFGNEVSLFDELHEKTFKRQNIERSERTSVLVRSICENAIAGGYGKMGIAYLDDLPVSAVLFLYDDRSAFYLFGVNDPEYRNTGSGTFTLMNMIKDAMNIGLKEVDFVGANSPQRADFKISFNATLKPYFESAYGK
jgi:lipid II:glycine glycyltransferase (peptidoglycan interpeptide bridge formation enzyme)